MNKGSPAISLWMVRKVRFFPAPPEMLGMAAWPAGCLFAFLFSASLMAARGGVQASACRCAALDLAKPARRSAAAP